MKKAIVAFAVTFQRDGQLLHKSTLYFRVLHINLFVIANLRRHNPVLLLPVLAFEHVAELTLVDERDNLVPFPKYFAGLELQFGHRVRIRTLKLTPLTIALFDALPVESHGEPVHSGAHRLRAVLLSRHLDARGFDDFAHGQLGGGDD